MLPDLKWEQHLVASARAQALAECRAGCETGKAVDIALKAAEKRGRLAGLKEAREIVGVGDGACPEG